MNHIKLAHPSKAGTHTIGGRGKVYINGHLVEGVLDFVPNLLSRDDIAHVVITLAVSTFTYEPEDNNTSVTMRD